MTGNRHLDQEVRSVTDVEYLHDYTMLLEFDGSGKRIVDFEPLMRGRHFFEELLDHKKFIQFALTGETLEWYNGVDFDPEYLYEHSTKPYDVNDDNTVPSAAEPAAVQ